MLQTPAPSHQDTDTQEVDWPDAIPVEILSQSEPVKIPQLEENLEEEQYQDLDTYLMHHNTFEASQRICQDYQSRLLTLDEEKYYEEVDRAFYTYQTPAA